MMNRDYASYPEVLEGGDPYAPLPLKKRYLQQVQDLRQFIKSHYNINIKNEDYYP